MNHRFLPALLMTCLAFPCHAGPQKDVEGIAGLIQSKYYDPERARKIADDLREAAAAGAFDRYAERTELAGELTRRLRALDGHFHVRWQSEDAPALAPKPASALPESRSNYGFGRVERLSGNVAYIDLEYAAHIDFAAADSPAKRTADAALALCRDADAVIIDVRRNGGGSPAMVGYLVSAFVAADANVYNTFHSRQGVSSERPQATYATPMISVPLYVLISGRTGSAAESIAFTLQSARRAVIVGERSGGAANPGGGFRTEQGYTVFIATGSPRNPLNGRNWEGDGVQPDVAVAAELAMSRAHELALVKILTGTLRGAARTDAQWALEALRAQARPGPAESTLDFNGQFGPYELEVIASTPSARRARWPAMPLVRLADDLYFFEGDPSRRLTLERRDGRVIAIRISSSDGNEQRFARTSND